MADISKITLPSGNTYDIKDTVARQMATGVMKIIGKTTTVLTDGCTTNPIDLITNPTTTPPTTISYTAEDGDTVIYNDAEFVWVDGTKIGPNIDSRWVEFGHLTGLGDMAYVDQGTVTIKPKGKNAASSVSFAAHTTATVLKSDVTATAPSYVANIKYLKASASGTTVGANGTGSALTGLGTASTDTFVKSYPGTTSKLVTSSVTGVSGSTTASKATAGTAVAVAKTGTAVNAVTSFTTPASGTVGNLLSTATVSNETLTFGSVTSGTTLITPAVSNGTITPYTFADVTVPKAATSATTVATGALAANGGGASVMTGLGTATTASAVTGYASPTSDTFLKGVKVTAQPTITLSGVTTTSADAIKYTEDISVGGTPDTVTINTNGHTANAITALGAGTAAAQTFTGTQETYDVNPKTT